MTNEELETKLLEVRKDNLLAVERLGAEIMDLRFAAEIHTKIINALAVALASDKVDEVARSYVKLWGTKGCQAPLFDGKKPDGKFPDWLSIAVSRRDDFKL